MPPSARRAALVVVGPDGGVLGRLSPLDLPTPWWQDARAVVTAAREAHGVDVVVLRLLDAERDRPHGGGVTYLVEVDAVTPALRATLEPWPGTLDEQPLRAPYARPGGPAADLRWADDVLARQGLARRGPAVQDRTWNLSSLWELPLAAGGDAEAVAAWLKAAWLKAAWLKVVPPFFAHEGALLALLAGERVPRLLGHDGARVVLAGVPGPDQDDAPLPVLLELVDLLVDLQARWAGRTHELLAAGVPDVTAGPMAAAVADVVARRGAELPASERAALARLVDGLPERLARVAACGLPDVLVHGDAHTGNLRGAPGDLTLLDWGDSVVGHPALDLPPLLAAMPEHADEVRDRWCARWREAVPGSDPQRAAELMAPVVAARRAAVYQRFVDGIEPVERRHHDADVLDGLRAAARALAG